MNNQKFKPRFHHLTPDRVQGFTLLELMIVLVIVSVLITFVSFTIRGHSPEDLIREEAYRLDRLVQLALEEAVMKNAEYGLEFKSNSYRFLTYIDNQWQAVGDDKLLRERELPEDMELELAIEQLDVIIGETAEPSDEDTDEEEKARPQVFLLSSEEITPQFSARFSLRGLETSYIVSGSIDGTHEVKLSDF